MHNDIRNAVSPYNSVGKLQVKWVPLAGPDAEEGEETPDWEGEEMIGKPWTYKIQIEGASGLPIMTGSQIRYTPKHQNTKTSKHQNTKTPKHQPSFVPTVAYAMQTSSVNKQ